MRCRVGLQLFGSFLEGALLAVGRALTVCLGGFVVMPPSDDHECSGYGEDLPVPDEEKRNHLTVSVVRIVSEVLTEAGPRHFATESTSDWPPMVNSPPAAFT